MTLIGCTMMGEQAGPTYARSALGAAALAAESEGLPTLATITVPAVRPVPAGLLIAPADVAQGVRVA